MHRVLVTGGRDFTDTSVVHRTLDLLCAVHGMVEVLVGTSRGVDAITQEWARINCLPCTPVAPDRKRDGASAWRNANQAMVDLHPDEVLAFPGGRGTTDCVRRAREAGLEVTMVR